jgi:mono/diheme cytochrome c family protein
LVHAQAIARLQHRPDGRIDRRMSPACGCRDEPSDITGMIMRRSCFALALIATFNNAAHALDREQQRGKSLLQSMCGRCHAVGETGRSRHADAPPFRTFGDDKLYDNDLGQRLQDGLTTIHPDMPTFHFGRGDAEAAVNYLKFIQRRRNPR